MQTQTSSAGRAYLRAGTAPHAIFSRISRKDKALFREKLFIRPGVQGRYMEKLTALLSQQIDKIWRADKG